MATKSILKDVVISDKRLAGSFVEALELAEKMPYQAPAHTIEVRDATPELITELFGKDASSCQCK